MSNDSHAILVTILDIEEFTSWNLGRNPKARAFRVRIDKTILTVEQPEPRGHELLTLANKGPVEGYLLEQKLLNWEMQTSMACRRPVYQTTYVFEEPPDHAMWNTSFTARQHAEIASWAALEAMQDRAVCTGRDGP